MSKLEKIQELLREKAEVETWSLLLPYKCTHELKSNANRKYICIRKRKLGKLSSF